MEIAKQWHTTPMRVVGGSKLLWYVRASAVRDYEIKAMNKRARDAQNALKQTRNRK